MKFQHIMQLPTKQHKPRCSTFSFAPPWNAEARNTNLDLCTRHSVPFLQRNARAETIKIGVNLNGTRRQERDSGALFLFHCLRNKLTMSEVNFFSCVVALVDGKTSPST